MCFVRICEQTAIISLHNSKRFASVNETGSSLCGMNFFLLFRLISGFTDSCFVPSLRQSVAGLSPRRPGFDSSPDYAKFMVDKTTMGQVYLRVLRLPPVITIPPMLHTHLHLNTILIITTRGAKRENHQAKQFSSRHQALR